MALNRKVNELVGLVTSRVLTPFHSLFNSSIDGYKYMSTFSFFMDSLPCINKVNIMKNHFVVNQGGKL